MIKESQSITETTVQENGLGTPIFLQRKCGCGQHTIAGKHCDECNAKSLGLRRTSHSAGRDGQTQREVPEIVNRVLQSTGQPLDTRTRSFFEPRLGTVLRKTGPAQAHVLAPQKMAISEPGDFDEQQADQIADQVVRSPSASEGMATSNKPHYDLSGIRVHTDSTAAQAAQAVNALAFTVGQHVVFGAGHFAPHSPSGRRLMAHELAHTAQQTPKLSCAVCLDAAVCGTIKTPSQLRTEAKKPENVKQDEERKKQCGKVPEDPGCRGDGHAKKAVELESLLNKFDKTPLKTSQGIFVNKDLEADFGALTVSCQTFVPPLAPTGHCITVPAKMEEEAALFNSTTGPLMIGGMERGLWRDRTLEKLVHEAGHTKFRSKFQTDFQNQFSTTVPHLLGKSRPTCKTDEASQRDVFSSLNELTAMVQEFPVRKQYLKVTVRLSADEKLADLEEWRDHRVRGTRQSITNSLRVVRCLCDCVDADAMVRETVEFATGAWTAAEKADLNAEMNDPLWASLKLQWPFAAPATAPKAP